MGEEALFRQLSKEFAVRFRPDPKIYWTDLLLSALAGWGLFFWAYRLGPEAGVSYWLLCFVASIPLLRATYFIHEIAHIQKRHLPGFELGWHLVIGIWMLVPSLMISAHVSHHRRSTYGTVLDPEYAPIARWSALRFAIDLLLLTIVPPLLVLRWGVLTPLSLFSKTLDRVLIERASTLAINPQYVRPIPDARVRKKWRKQELGMMVFVFAAAGLVALQLFLHWWLVASMALIANQLRTYVAHAYEGDGAPMTRLEQLADTITIGGWPVLTDLFAPVGDRFHAIHHLFPFLPYHAYSAAHRRLLEVLPEGAIYRTTIRRGLVRAWTRFIKAA